MLSDGQTAGVFQLQTSNYTRICKLVGIDKFLDITVVIAGGKPAPNRYGVPPKYAHFKKTGEAYKVHPLVDEYLSDVGGIPMFQENVMIIFNKIGNFYLVDTNAIVRAISKSKGIISFSTYRGKFVEGAKKNGLEELEANKLFDQIFQFGSFGLNRSHSCGYAYIAYYSAWLKYYHRVDFYASALNHSSVVEKQNIIDEALRLGYTITQPDINLSDPDKIVGDEKTNRIILPLSEIKYLTTKQKEKIVLGRPFKNLDDVLKRVRMINKARESFIACMSPINTIADIIKIVKYMPTFSIYRHKDDILKEIKGKIKQKLFTYPELGKENGKRGSIILIMSDRAKLSNWGDWKPFTELPSEEERNKKPSEWKFLNDASWMSKWAKISCVDFVGSICYFELKPKTYDRYATLVKTLKRNDIIIAEVQHGWREGSRGTLFNLTTIEKLFSSSERTPYEKELLGEQVEMVKV
jgi:hypothetical protein